MSDHDSKPTENNERQPGLREETIREMRKRRHAYPHEVVALCDEILELRKLHNKGAVLATSGKERSIYIPEFDKSMWEQLGSSGRDAAMEISVKLDNLGDWSDLYPGRALWSVAYDILRRELQEKP